MEITERLCEVEWLALRLVNQALTKITIHHAHYCECELCQARVLTDTQDTESRVVTYIPAPNGSN